MIEATQTEPALNVLLDELEDQGHLGDPLLLQEAFEAWAASTGRPLYPHQAEASMCIMVEQSHVIASTPTGSGKSLIAVAAHLLSLSRGGRSYYTAPLKALVSEKFFELVSLFGANNVGMVTGDVSLNSEAPLICCTAEILANLALREGPDLQADTVVMDEFHYYGDDQRGWAWQVPLLLLDRPQFVLLSATLGNTDFIAKDLETRTGRQVSVLADAPRPVPLEFNYSLEPIGELLERLIGQERTPAYVVHSSQRAAVAQAQALLAIDLKAPNKKDAIAQALGDFRFTAGFGKTLSALLRKGIGVHHAGMLPRYRRLVERLTQEGLLTVICGTDTLGVGINVPIRSVVMTSLVKFDGTQERHLSAREFHQISGRAGRAGFDTVGFIEVQAPEHVIENAAALKRAGDDERKRRKIIRKKAPEGKVNWTDKTFERLVASAPETLVSQFSMTHSMVLATMQRPGKADEHLLDLATNNHDLLASPNGPLQTRNTHLRTLAQVVQSLKQAEVCRFTSSDNSLVLAEHVPDNFALNSPLSPFALAAIDALEPLTPAGTQRPDYALDVLSIVEAISEDPGALLYAQRAEAKGAAIGALKAQGVDYEERMRLVEDVTWPKPLEELINGLFAIYLQSNPWAKGFEPKPKSVVRLMIENSMTFTELVSRYDIARQEGIVLRYLTDVYRSLRQVVPTSAMTPQLIQITEWLGSLVRSVDSSLLDEWEQIEAIQDGRALPGHNTPAEAGGTEEALAFGVRADGKADYSLNPAALARDLRKACFRLVEACAQDNPQLCVKADTDNRHNGDFPSLPALDHEAWDAALGNLWEEHEWVDTSMEGRSPARLLIEQGPALEDWARAGVGQAFIDAALEKPGAYWLVEQVLADDSGDDDFRLGFVVDVLDSQKTGQPSVACLGLRTL
ncbi:MAG: DUF3516 domain-containing protein [Actinomycetaceae bacterium]|nr:DUF3516 domain-containing protein [Actinomycetaceae bacterium]